MFLPRLRRCFDANCGGMGLTLTSKLLQLSEKRPTTSKEYLYHRLESETLYTKMKNRLS